MESDAYQYRVIKRQQFIRSAVLTIAVMAIIVALLLTLVQMYLAGLVELAELQPALAAQRTSNVLQLVLAIVVVFAVGVGSYAIWYGLRAIKSGSFPPPGAWVIEGRPIHTGDKAQRIALAQIVLGILIPVVACYAVYRAWALLP